MLGFMLDIYARIYARIHARIQDDFITFGKNSRQSTLVQQCRRRYSTRLKLFIGA
jgi:hypothetical protein